MAKDFDQSDHKNLELLRFYITKDINKIDKKIQDSNSDIVGYFTASLVDVLIVIIFDDYWKCDVLWLRIICIVGLIVLFFIVSKLIIWLIAYTKSKGRESGRELYIEENIRDKIDAFDNIACDSLLICENYIQKYNDTAEDKKYLRDFYIFEIIHYLKKACMVYNFIHSNPTLYISSDNKELLDSYRVKNFVCFAKEINQFLQQQGGEFSMDTELSNELKNLKATIDRW